MANYLKTSSLQTQDRALAQTIAEIDPFVGALEYSAHTGVLRMKLNASNPHFGQSMATLRSM